MGVYRESQRAGVLYFDLTKKDRDKPFYFDIGAKRFALLNVTTERDTGHDATTSCYCEGPLLGMQI
jgi:hypothetical protein